MVVGQRLHPKIRFLASIIAFFVSVFPPLAQQGRAKQILQQNNKEKLSNTWILKGSTCFFSFSALKNLLFLCYYLLLFFVLYRQLFRFSLEEDARGPAITLKKSIPFHSIFIKSEMFLLTFSI